MTQGRKASQPATIAVEADAAVVRNDLDAIDTTAMMLMTQNENAAAVARQLGYEGALTVGALEDEIRFYQRRTVEACLELGKRLLILREIAPHGEFGQRLDLLGIAPRLAQQFMAAVVKFSNAKSTSLLTAAGSQTKLLELLVLDDAEIEALDGGDSVRGIKLDDIETMSVRELRTALRAAKADAEAQRKVAADKNTKIDTLAVELEKSRRLVETRPRDEALEALRLETAGKAIAAEAAVVNDLAPAIAQLLAADPGLGTYCGGLLAQVEESLAEIRRQHGLNGAELAAWVGDAADDIARMRASAN